MKVNPYINFVCDPDAVKSSAIDSRGVDLFKTSKIIQKYFFIMEKNDFENFHFFIF